MIVTKEMCIAARLAAFDHLAVVPGSVLTDECISKMFLSMLAEFYKTVPMSGVRGEAVQEIYFIERLAEHSIAVVDEVLA